jgi:hypothetical protein
MHSRTLCSTTARYPHPRSITRYWNSPDETSRDFDSLFLTDRLGLALSPALTPPQRIPDRSFLGSQNLTDRTQTGQKFCTCSKASDRTVGPTDVNRETDRFVSGPLDLNRWPLQRVFHLCGAERRRAQSKRSLMCRSRPSL